MKIYNGEFLTALIDFDKDLVFNRFLREKLYSMKNQPYIFLGGKIPNSKYVSFIKFKIVIKAAKGTPPRKKIPCPNILALFSTMLSLIF